MRISIPIRIIETVAKAVGSGVTDFSESYQKSQPFASPLPSGLEIDKTGQRKIALNDVFRGIEDRNNDWLARQIREENRIMMRGVLSDIGAAHSVKCDARDIKKTHHIFHLLGKEEL